MRHVMHMLLLLIFSLTYSHTRGWWCAVSLELLVQCSLQLLLWRCWGSTATSRNWKQVTAAMFACPRVELKKKKQRMCNASSVIPAPICQDGPDTWWTNRRWDKSLDWLWVTKCYIGQCFPLPRRCIRLLVISGQLSQACHKYKHYYWSAETV